MMYSCNLVLMFKGAANIVTGTRRSLFSMVKTYVNVRNYSPLFMLSDNKAACGFNLDQLFGEPSIVLPVIEELCRLYEDGKIKPIIDSVWAFEDVGPIVIGLSYFT